jgi:polyisoprenoid-binding protein YceI
VRYKIDQSGSRLTARAFAAGALSAVGHDPTFAFRDVSGEVEYDPEAPATSSLRLVVAAGSLAVTDGVSDKDRREIERATREDVLETDKSPEITYECPSSRITVNGPTQLTLAGDLTLHGVTRPQTVSVRVFLMGETLRGQGEAVVRQSEYDIKPVSAMAGMLKVKDEVKLTFDVVARAVPERRTGGKTTDAKSSYTGAERRLTGAVR